MFILTILANIFFSDLRTSLFSLIVGYLVYKLARFYVYVLSLPPGPLPVPFLGNILAFRGTKEHWARELEKIVKKYGQVCTIWVGNKPFVMINDIDLARDAFRKNDFAGRPQDFFSKLFVNDKRTDVVFADYGHDWEALRRVAHSAVMKYSTTDKLVYLACDTVDHTIDSILKKEGLNNPFAPFDYIYNTFLNILATSAFGKRYEMDDPEYKQIKYIQKDLFKEFSVRLFFWNVSAFARWVDKQKVKRMQDLFQSLIDMLKTKFVAHYKDYDESVIRDFCDSLIAAKNEALREGKESAPYLTDDNLAMVVFDLFFAGTDTSQMTFRWCLTHMLYNKDIEKTLRREIESEIGDRIPTHEDRNRCHYTMAFISETLRHSNIVGTGVQHKAVVTAKLGDYTIPEGTDVLSFNGYILHKEEYWDRPFQFIPERFLDSKGQYMTTRPKAFIPFGLGRRVCLGEKLALADLFLVLVRFIQKTSDYELVLHCEPEVDLLSPDPNNIMEFDPIPYKISFKEK